MNIHIVGKRRHKGVSKLGRQYDFIEIHFVAPARGVDGEAAQTATFDPEVFPYEQIGRGVYNADFDSRGTLLSLTPVQAPASK